MSSYICKTATFFIKFQLINKNQNGKLLASPFTFVVKKEVLVSFVIFYIIITVRVGKNMTQIITVALKFNSC